MSFSIRFNDDEERLVRDYARVSGITVSELMRQSVLDRILDEHDLTLYHQAMKEHLSNPKTFTLDEVERELGLK